jgi:hypothetical protein
MKSTLISILLCLVTAPQITAQQSTEPGMRSEKIIVRILNAKDGKPVKHEMPNIWLGEGKSPSLPLANKGEVTVEIGSIRPREIRVMPNLFVDCRYKGDSSEGRLVRYSVDEIASKGVVAENQCGQAHVVPIPGVLVLYVRSRTRKEKREL